MKNLKNSKEDSTPVNDRDERSGIIRRELLKTFAMFSAAPLATQALSGASSDMERPVNFHRELTA